MSYTIYVCDTETTGLDPEENEIIELAMTRLRPQADGSYQEEVKSWLIKAMSPQTISEEALKVSGHKREDILHQTKFGRENYLLPEQVLQEVDAWIMDDDVSALDRVFVGQNPTFDLGFLKSFWKRYDDIQNFPFEVSRNNRVLDTKQIVILFDLCTGRRRQAYNLGSLVKHIGIKKGKAHRADEDTRMTKDLLLKLIQIIQTVVKDNFQECYGSEDLV